MLFGYEQVVSAAHLLEAFSPEKEVEDGIESELKRNTFLKANISLLASTVNASC